RARPRRRSRWSASRACRRRGDRGPTPILEAGRHTDRPPRGTSTMHFYELHEGDDDVFSDILLAREEEIEPEEFFELVQGIRHRIIDSYEHDTLVAAIADELERNHE